MAEDEKGKGDGAKVERMNLFVDVKSFVEKRAEQVADLLQMIDNKSLVAGEVTKGPRTAAQRLPRHMRRRAMAYDVRRFPKGMRPFAQTQMTDSKHRNKPPSRFARRKPSNILQNYIRRQMKAVWLESHIWHAKRFHMVSRWGYKIADRSFQRHFRPIYRDAMHHCCVRDKSYLTCFVLFHPSQPFLIESLRELCAPQTGPTFAFRSSLDGKFEISSLLYERGRYPNGFIGPVRFSWSKSESDRFSLSIWTHPANRTAVLNELVKAFGLKKTQKEDDDIKIEEVKKEADWRLKKQQVFTDIYNGENDVEFHDLRDQLIRLRLYGPNSICVAANVLKLVSGDEAQSYRKNNEMWNDLISKCSPDQLTDGLIIPLLVEDPRIFRPSRRKPFEKINPGRKVEALSQNLTATSDIWSRDARIQCLEKRMSESQFQKQQGLSAASGLTQTDAKIPILVVIRNSGSKGGKTLDGIEIIAPAGFGRDLWIALHLATAHASGRRDDLAAHLEAGRFDFPEDMPDCEAGRGEAKRLQYELEDAYAKRPHNRRVNYWQRLSIQHPFSFEWSQLLHSWTAPSCDSSKQLKQPYVLRDRRALMQIAEWLKGHHKRPDGILSEHAHSLVPVFLDSIAEGRPRRYGLICLPNSEDLENLRRRPKNGKISSIVQEPRKEKKKKTEEESSVEMEDVENGKEGKDAEFWKDIISLDPQAKEKPISLKGVFKEKLTTKKERRHALNRKKKAAKKRAKNGKLDRLRKANEEIEEKEKIDYRYAANRETLGRIVRGDYSFWSARGRALGYVPLAAIEQIKRVKCVVLARNTTSKYYHFMKLAILHERVEI